MGSLVFTRAGPGAVVTEFVSVGAGAAAVAVALRPELDSVPVDFEEVAFGAVEFGSFEVSVVTTPSGRGAMVVFTGAELGPVEQERAIKQIAALATGARGKGFFMARWISGCCGMPKIFATKVCGEWDINVLFVLFRSFFVLFVWLWEEL